MASRPSRAAHVSASARHAGAAVTPGTGGPAQRRPGGLRPSGRGRALPWLIAGAGAVVVVLIVLLIVHLAGGGSSAANTGHPGGSGGTGTSGAPPTASRGPLIPAAFNGTWSGQVSQPPSDTYNVTVTLTAGQPSGAISYSGAGANCSGDLTPTSVSPTSMVMKIGIVQGQKSCGNGTVRITVDGPNALTFDAGSQAAAATGTLNRQ